MRFTTTFRIERIRGAPSQAQYYIGAAIELIVMLNHSPA